MAAPFVGVPWIPRGDAPTGWDCRGCVAYLRRHIFGLESPGMTRDAYTAADVRSPERVEELVLERVGLWRPGDARPGAVILFQVFGRAAHVGLVLSSTDFVHSFGGQETTILRLDAPAWGHRVRGFYDTEHDGDHRPGTVHPAR